MGTRTSWDLKAVYCRVRATVAAARKAASLMQETLSQKLAEMRTEGPVEVAPPYKLQIAAILPLMLPSMG